jgi:hypothetical protein
MAPARWRISGACSNESGSGESQDRHDGWLRRLFDSTPNGEPESPADLQNQIASLAEFAVRARTHVPRDPQKKYILSIPEPEGPTRLGQQLAQIAKASAAIDHRSAANDHAVEIATRVAVDCIPSIRWKIVKFAIRCACTTSAVLLAPEIPKTKKQYAEKDLCAVGLFANGSLSGFA